MKLDDAVRVWIRHPLLLSVTTLSPSVPAPGHFPLDTPSGTSLRHSLPSFRVRGRHEANSTKPHPPTISVPRGVPQPPQRLATWVSPTWRSGTTLSGLSVGCRRYVGAAKTWALTSAELPQSLSHLGPTSGTWSTGRPIGEGRAFTPCNLPGTGKGPSRSQLGPEVQKLALHEANPSSWTTRRAQLDHGGPLRSWATWGIGVPG